MTTELPARGALDVVEVTNVVPTDVEVDAAALLPTISEVDKSFLWLSTREVYLPTPGRHWEYHWFWKEQNQPGSQVVGPDQFVPPPERSVKAQ